MIYLILFLLFISAVSKSIQDKIQFHFHKSIFKNLGDWWDPKKSWKNKHNWFKESKILTWLISNPLVFITDAWHFFGLIRDFCLFFCIPLALNNYWILLLYVPYRITFHLFFTYFFSKK